MQIDILNQYQGGTRIGGLEDDRQDSAASHITFGAQLGRYRQRGLAICTFHLGFGLDEYCNDGLPNMVSATLYSATVELSKHIQVPCQVQIVRENHPAG